MSTDERQARILAATLRAHQEAPHPGLQGTHLRLHVTVHTVVETQLEAQDPPFVPETLARLMVGGLERHHAIHAIASVAVREVLEALGQSYDEERYRSGLEALDPARWRGGLELGGEAAD